jgi:hypothetical protein
MVFGETSVASMEDSIEFRFSTLDKDRFRLDLRGTQIGEWSGVFRMPFDSATWAAVMASLESGYDPVASDAAARSNLQTLGNRAQLPQSVGAALAEALLEDDGIRQRFNSARNNAEVGRSTLPVELRFGEGCDVLASLPWELMHYDGRFLVADTTIALSRYPEGGFPLSPALAELPLRVLLLLPEPEGLPPTFPGDARHSLVDGLKGLDAKGDVVVDELEPPTYPALIDAVTTRVYHMLVFIGHGVYKEGAGSFLVFEDETGKRERISADDVGSTLRNTDVRLVLLGACQSTTITSTSGDGSAAPPDIWQGTAQAFLRAGVPLSIGMQVVVRVDAAQAFIHQFASSLAAGKSVLEATADGRKSLKRPRYNDAWFIPALYGRPKGDTRLFEPHELPENEQVKPTPGPKPPAPSPTPPSTTMDRTELRKFLSKRFSLEELKLLAYELDVEIDELEGSGKTSKIIALVTYFERRGRYQELVDTAVAMQSEL